MPNSPEITGERLALWRGLCEWLEEQPYNQHYKPPGIYGALIDPSRKAAAERKHVALIFWQNGGGWRLHKNWAARLAELEAGIQ